MNKFKGLLTATGIVSLVFGIILTITIIGSIIGIPLIVGGSMYLYYSSLNDEQLINKKSSILAWSIAFIFLNIISSILSFIVYGNIIKSIKSDPKTFRLNFLLTIGMVLILLSGILIASNSWSYILDYVKFIILMVFGILFIILSIIFSKQEKLIYASNLYWVIGVLLVVLGIYSSGYFELFGNYFSLNGLGRNLFISFVVFIATIVLYLSYKKFNSKFFIRLSFLSFYVSLGYFISHFYNSIEQFSIVYIAVITFFNIIFKGKSEFSKEFMMLNNIITYLYLILIFAVNTVSTDLCYVTLNDIIYVINLLLISQKSKSNGSYVFMSISVPIIIMLYLYSFLDFLPAIIFSTATIFVYYLGSFINRKNSYIYIPCLVVSNILLFINYVLSYFCCYSFIPMIISLVLVLLYVPMIFVKDYQKKYFGELIIQPIKLFLLCCGSSFFLTNSGYSLSLMSHLVVWSNILLIFSVINKNNLLKNIYFIFSFILLLSCITPNNLHIIFRVDIVIMWLLGYLMLIAYNNKLWLNKLNFIFYLVSLGVLYQLFNYLSFSVQLALLNIIIFATLAYIYRFNKFKCFVSLLFILLPYYSLINIISINSSVLTILKFMPIVMYTYLFTLVITTKYKVFNTISEIIISLSVLFFLIFEGSLETTIFVGVLSIIFIIFDIIFYKKSLFVVGISSLSLDILFNLFKYWSNMLSWIFLLIGGIAIVSIITIQQIRKK